MKKACLIILLSSGVLAIAFLPRRSASSQNATWRPAPKSGDALKVIVVTGGHDHDPDFYSVFDDKGIKALVVPHPGAFRGDIRKRADVLVLYDMLKEMEPNRQKNLQLGHDRNAHLNPIYQKLVRNAILWTGGMLK